MRAADAATIRARHAVRRAHGERGRRALSRAPAAPFPTGGRVVVVCGPGNNGGDGLAAARLLAQRGRRASTSSRSAIRPRTAATPRSTSAGRAPSASCRPRSPSRGGLASLAPRARRSADGVVDALFGTGLGAPARGRRAAGGRGDQRVRASPSSPRTSPRGCPPTAAPSSGAAVRAAVTVAFGAPKLCHVLAPASGLCGRVVVADIGIPRADAGTTARGGSGWPRRPTRASCFRRGRSNRTRRTSDGSRSSPARAERPGAAILAARGALRAGAGLVTVFCAESLEGLVVAALPEAMTFGLPEAGGAPRRPRARARCSGAGGIRRRRGRARAWARRPRRCVFSRRSSPERGYPFVADADALNAFSGRAAFFAKTARSDRADAAPRRGGAAPGDDVGANPGGPASRRDGCSRDEPRGRRPQGRPQSRRRARRGRSPSTRPARRCWRPPGRATCSSGVVGALLAGGLGAARGRGGGRVAARSGGRVARAPLFGDAGLLAHEVADAVPLVRAALRS